MEKYQERFEDLRVRMLYHNPNLTEQYFIESYISGLKEELVSFIDLAQPSTLEEIYEQAKLHEQALAVMWRKSKVVNKINPSQLVGYYALRIATQGEAHKPQSTKIANLPQGDEKQQ